jgi:ABC-type Mn2+/Zn2+ transport system ATPase subunit
MYRGGKGRLQDCDKYLRFRNWIRCLYFQYLFVVAVRPYGRYGAIDGGIARFFEMDKIVHRKKNSRANKPDEIPHLQAKFSAELQAYLKSVKTSFDAVNPLPVQYRTSRNIAFIGPVSSGKSCLLNCLFGLRLKAGVQLVPTEFAVVRYIEDRNIAIWDSPGTLGGVLDAKDPKYFIEVLKKLYYMDTVVILISTDILMIKDLVSTCTILGKKMFIVRTRVDTIRQNHIEQDEPALEDILARDLNAITTENWDCTLFHCCIRFQRSNAEFFSPNQNDLLLENLFRPPATASTAPVP